MTVGKDLKWIQLDLGEEHTGDLSGRVGVTGLAGRGLVYQEQEGGSVATAESRRVGAGSHVVRETRGTTHARSEDIHYKKFGFTHDEMGNC